MNYVEMKFTRDKKVEFDNSLLLYLRKMLHSHTNRRLFIVSDKVKNIDELKQFMDLVCFSELHKNYFGQSNEYCDESLLIPFFAFDNNKLKIITTESFDTIVDAVWNKKKETDKGIERERIEKLYKKLLKVIEDKMKNSKEWQEARERSKNFRSFDSSMLAKYDK